MIKICPRCRSTWAGGMACEDCGSPLVDPVGAEAQAFPEDVWRYIRLQYGARRGMIVRVLAILLGAASGLLLARQAAALPAPFVLPGALLGLLAGLALWRALHVAAGRAVRLWVLRRGRVSKTRLLRAAWRRALR